MHPKYAEVLLATVRKRISEGDCPITPALSIGQLEELVDQFASELADARAKALEEAAQIAFKRATVCSDAADLYERNRPGEPHLAATERCAAIEARHIYEKIRALAQPEPGEHATDTVEETEA